MDNNLKRGQGQTLRQNMKDSGRKLTTEDIKRIIRESRSHPAKDEDTPYADVPSAQPPSQPFTPATHRQLESASVEYGNRNDETTVIVSGMQPQPSRFNGYIRSVLGVGNMKEKPIDRLSKALWGKK
jgi:hypothetical protein